MTSIKMIQRSHDKNRVERTVVTLVEETEEANWYTEIHIGTILNALFGGEPKKRNGPPNIAGNVFWIHHESIRYESDHRSIDITLGCAVLSVGNYFILSKSSVWITASVVENRRNKHVRGLVMK